MVNFIQGFTHLLITKVDLKALLFVKKFDDADYTSIIDNHLSIKHLFSDLVRVIMKKSHDNLFHSKKPLSTNTSTVLTSNSFAVDKIVVFTSRVSSLFYSILKNKTASTC